jgi:hypothetical protein
MVAPKRGVLALGFRSLPGERLEDAAPDRPQAIMVGIGTAAASR